MGRPECHCDAGQEYLFRTLSVLQRRRGTFVGQCTFNHASVIYDSCLFSIRSTVVLHVPWSTVGGVFVLVPLPRQYNVNHMHTEYPHIPPAVDYVSTDDYGSINTGGFNSSQIKHLSNAMYQYPRFLYPKMFPHQGVFVIPPISNFTFHDCEYDLCIILYIFLCVTFFSFPLVDNDERI